MPHPMRWAERYPEEARIAVGLRERGFSRKQVRDWLKSEGHEVSEGVLTDLVAEAADPKRREKDLARLRREGKARWAKNAHQRAAERAARRDYGKEVQMWFDHEDFNPDTGRV